MQLAVSNGVSAERIPTQSCLSFQGLIRNPPPPPHTHTHPRDIHHLAWLLCLSLSFCCWRRCRCRWWWWWWWCLCLCCCFCCLFVSFFLCFFVSLCVSLNLSILHDLHSIFFLFFFFSTNWSWAWPLCDSVHNSIALSPLLDVSSQIVKMAESPDSIHMQWCHPVLMFRYL